jgi:5'-phosphate synthase pdxT subunit
VRVNRNHFGRQTESFQAPIDLPFLQDSTSPETLPFNGVFIRAPVVEKILPHQKGIQIEEVQREETVVAPSREVVDSAAKRVIEDEVEILAKLPGRAARLVANSGVNIDAEKETGDIIAVKQGNVFGTSFHPELTDDPRIHLWWLRQVQDALLKRNGVV